MHAMTMMAPPPGAALLRQGLAQLKARGARIGPLACIVALHLVLFYLLQSGLLRKAARAALPEVIHISFIAPPAPPKTSAPATPKTVPVARPTPAVAAPPPPLVSAPAAPSITPPAQAATAAVPAMLASAPAAASPAPAPPRMASSVEYLRPPQPVYPAISRRIGESGLVVLRILIGETGQPEQVTVQKSSGFANLDEAGRQAALRALFKPHMEDGKPVAVFVLVPLNFQLG